MVLAIPKFQTENEINKVLQKNTGNNSLSNFNALVDPLTNSHIILLYEEQIDLEKSLSTYINEGLRRNQVCVHASYQVFNQEYLQRFSSNIVNYEENIEKGNLLVIDLSGYYIEAMTGNLLPFDKLKDKLTIIGNNLKENRNNHIRMTADCATLLLKNRHFNECIRLEEWWHQKPFVGSYICPYPKSLFSQFPYNVYLSRIFHTHDIIVDTEGNLIPEFMNLTSHQLANT